MIIQNINLTTLTINNLLEQIKQTINKGNKCKITYFNVNSFNSSFNNNNIKNFYINFNIVHPDGIGIFLASRFLHGKSGLSERINGSDLYEHLLTVASENKWKIFLFGDTDETLNKVSTHCPDLVITGKCNGYNYDESELIDEINISETEILIVGLGSPKQEEWIIKNKDSIKANVVIAVGDGIKVFAGTKKRGPKFIQKIGLEWFVRFLYEPKRLWKRYIIGIPLFIFRVIKIKFTQNHT